jgi:hypothetical protein
MDPIAIYQRIVLVSHYRERELNRVMTMVDQKKQGEFKITHRMSWWKDVMYDSLSKILSLRHDIWRMKCVSAKKTSQVVRPSPKPKPAISRS